MQNIIFTTDSVRIPCLIPRPWQFRAESVRTVIIMQPFRADSARNTWGTAKSSWSPVGLVILVEYLTIDNKYQFCQFNSYKVHLESTWSPDGVQVFRQFIEVTSVPCIIISQNKD